VLLEGIEVVLAALIKKADLMHEETTSPEPQGFEKAIKQERSAEVLLEIQRPREGKAEGLHSG
jgi:hypothetical protein